MPAYVTLPGTNANYFDSADDNLLESDDAHFHQSIGNWTAGAGASTLTQDTGGSPQPQFGDGTAKATTDGTGAVIASLTPSLSAAEHTVSIDIYCTTASREAFITLDGTDGTVTALTAGTWVRLSATKTVTAGTKTVTVTYRNVNDSDPSASEEVWIDRACLVTGTSTAFVPSIRIVGDLDMEAKLAATDWTPASTFDVLNRRGAGSYGYALRVTNTGQIAGYAGSGSSDRVSTSNATGFTDGTTHVIRATFDVSSGEWNHYHDGVLDDTDTVASGAIAYTAVHELGVGASTFGTTALAGDLYYAHVRDGFGGPVVARFDADDWVGV